MRWKATASTESTVNERKIHKENFTINKLVSNCTVTEKQRRQSYERTNEIAVDIEIFGQTDGQCPEKMELPNIRPKRFRWRADGK